MRHIAAYLLCQIGGNASPSAEDIKTVLAAGGVEADDERLEKLISELEGKSMDQLIAEGAGKMASVPSGGAVASGAGAGAPSGGAAAAEEEAPKEEEKKEEEKEESDDDMGFGLFD